MTPEQKLEAARATVEAWITDEQRWYGGHRQWENDRDALIASAREAGAAEERAKVSAAWRARIVEGSEGWWHPTLSNIEGHEGPFRSPVAESVRGALIRLPDEKVWP